jgi:hypothetical protein
VITVSALKAEDVVYFINDALSAEPYPEGDPIRDQFDGEFPADYRERMNATIAREILRRNGIILEETEAYKQMMREKGR